MSNFLSDLRHAWRAAIKAPGVSAVAVLTIALGMGANTAIFSLVNATLLRPHFHDPDSLIVIGNHYPNLENGPASLPDFIEWRKQTQAFGELAAYYLDLASLAGNALPQRVPVSLVSESYFHLLQISPQVGRLSTPSEHREGAAPVCMISDALWRREFQAATDIVGRTALLDGVSYSIVGVLRPDTPSFSYPEKTEIWIPLEPHAPFKEHGENYLDIMGRLKPGVPLARARAEMETIQNRINAEFPDNRHTVSLRPLSQALFGSTAPVLLVLLAAAGVVVLIGCANLANLLLVRSKERCREFAIRQALGAQRNRILQLLLTEGLLIASLGGVIGTFLALFSEHFLIVLAPRGMRLPESVDLDWRMWAFSLSLIVLVALVSGTAPAIWASRVHLNEALRLDAHQVTEGSRRLGARQRLVVAETALATVLLAGAFLTLESLWKLIHTDPGFSSGKVLTMQVSLPASRYSTDSKQVQFFAQLLQRIRSLPGVLSAGAITDLPIGEGSTTGDFVIEGRPKPSSDEQVFVGKEIVTPGYFEAMKIPLVAGKLFTEQDCGGGGKVAIISRRMATQFWPGQDPVGLRLDLGLGKQDDWQRVIGVVGDVKSEGLDAPAMAVGYLCAAQYPSTAMAVVIRTGPDPKSLASAARSAVLSVDSQQPISHLSVMDDVLWESLSHSRSLAWLLSAFAIIALLLAGIGVYGLTAYSVARRTAEIAIRMALGAHRHQVLFGVLNSGLKLAGIGLAIGLVVSAGSMQLLRHLLFGIGTLDPLVFLSTPMILGPSALLACYIPARRAATIDPMRALRGE
jgi:putative ABC transport system permease protein